MLFYCHIEGKTKQIPCSTPAAAASTRTRSI
jgi:hypothetical protein